MENKPSIINALQTALNLNKLHDLCVMDSDATDHMTNECSKLHNFEKFSKHSHVSIANVKGAKVLGKGKINLVSNKIESRALYVPSFSSQLLSVGKLTNALNCLAILSPHNVIFQDYITKKKIGGDFRLD